MVAMVAMVVPLMWTQVTKVAAVTTPHRAPPLILPPLPLLWTMAMLVMPLILPLLATLSKMVMLLMLSMLLLLRQPPTVRKTRHLRLRRLSLVAMTSCMGLLHGLSRLPASQSRRPLAW